MPRFDPRFTDDEALALEDGEREVFEAAERAGMRWRLDEALAAAMRESGGTPTDAMVAVLRKWFRGEYPTLPNARLPDREGVRGIRKVLRAYGAMESRHLALGPPPGGSDTRVKTD